jgi:hypothetical protein
MPIISLSLSLTSFQCNAKMRMILFDTPTNTVSDGSCLSAVTTALHGAPHIEHASSVRFDEGECYFLCGYLCGWDGVFVGVEGMGLKRLS